MTPDAQTMTPTDEEMVACTSAVASEAPTAESIMAAIADAISRPIITTAFECEACEQLNKRRVGLPLGSVALCETCFRAIAERLRMGRHG